MTTLTWYLNPSDSDVFLVGKTQSPVRDVRERWRGGYKMDKRPNHLSLVFQAKGFLPVEIPGLIKDVFIILKQGRHNTLPEVNRELEDLGWGIDIMDKATYESL